MANLLLIKDLAEKKNLTLRELACRIGMTDDGLQKLMTKGSTKTSTLEEISRVLEVSPGIFFDGYIPTTNQSIANGNGSASSVYGNATAGVIADKDKEIEHLKELLKEKERLIQVLMNK